MLKETKLIVPEAEQSFLGALLFEPSLVKYYKEFVKPEDFYYTDFQEIYRILVYLDDNDEGIDYTTIVNEFKKTEKTEQEIKEFAETVVRLSDLLPTSTYSDSYLKYVLSASTRRKLTEIALNTKNLAAELSDEDLVQHINSLKDDLDNLLNQNVKPSIIDMEELCQKAKDKYEFTENAKNKCIQEGKPFCVGVPTGFKKLDDLTLGMQKNNLIILAARPSVGKSALGLNISINAAEKGYHVAFFSCEMGDISISDRLIATISSIDSKKIQETALNEKEYNKYLFGLEELKKLPIHLIAKSGITLTDINSYSRYLAEQNKLDLIIIDYLGFITPEKNNKSIYEQVSMISRKLKDLAKELNVPIITLAQLNRQVEQREGHVPNLSDLRDSGSIEQDADIIMFLYRKDYNISPIIAQEDLKNGIENNMVEAELSIAKNRQGALGVVPLYFNKPTGKFTERTV